jgi:acyl-CoA thioester hydrolase
MEPVVYFTTERRAAFRDTDAAGIVHFSVFFVWMEDAEHAFLRARGLSVMQVDEHHTLGWPRVSASCDYLRPVRFEEAVTIAVSIDRVGAKSITYAFRFTVGTDLVAQGKLVAACCTVTHEDNLLQAIPIPPDFLRQLGVQN